MATAAKGDTVKMHYTGTLTDGTVFDSSQDGDPLEFVVGEGEVIAGLDSAVVGMAPNDTKKVTIPADEAYGQPTDDLVFSVPRTEVPEELSPEVGMELQVRRDDDQTMPVVVTEVTDDNVTLDANHPLAGKDLTFDITLVAIG